MLFKNILAVYRQQEGWLSYVYNKVYIMRATRDLNHTLINTRLILTHIGMKYLVSNNGTLTANVYNVPG